MPKTPGSGRKKGTPNKRTQQAAEILAEVGCDPLRKMAEIASDPNTPLDLRVKLYSDLSQYVHPRRKAVEHTGAEGDPIEHSITVQFVE